MAVILGFSAWFHDSSACLVKDGKLIAFAEEERFSRRKHTSEFPKLAIDYCLQEAGLKLEDVDFIVHTSDPVRLTVRSFQILLRYFPKSLQLFKKKATHSSVTKRYMDMFLARSRIETEFSQKIRAKVIHLQHFKTHQGIGFFGSKCTSAAVLNMDFATEGNSQTIALGSGNNIDTLLAHNWPHAWGGVYLALTRYLGFKPFDEYKVMGMAAYGEPKYLNFFEKQLYNLDENTGKFALELKYFRYQFSGLEKPWSEELEKALGPARKNGEPLTAFHYDVAASLQAATENFGIKMARLAQKLTGQTSLCLAGGVVQNVLMNQKIIESGIFKEVYPQALCGDGGSCVGAALYYQHVVLKEKRNFSMEHLYWGPSYKDQVLASLDKSGLKYERNENPYADIAKALADGKIVGFFWGRMEAGPRALGARSILADPRRADMKDILNSRVKHREHFRPFAPACLEENLDQVFEVPKTKSDYRHMIATLNVRTEWKVKVPAITHQDGTARVQAVCRETHEAYWKTIDAFRQLTGVPLVINTSFNDNEPIVCTPDDAINCFKRTKIDLLVFPNCLVWRDKNQSLVSEQSI